MVNVAGRLNSGRSGTFVCVCSQANVFLFPADSVVPGQWEKVGKKYFCLDYPGPLAYNVYRVAGEA
jgi:hypothetical protein